MKKIMIFAAVATMFAACTKDATKDLAPAKPTDTFYATIGEEDPRVQLNEQMQTVWTEGDRVSVFNKTTGNRRYKFTGKTGDRTGELSYMNGGTTGDAISQVVAVYPYNSASAISADGSTITTTISARQTYCKDSFGAGSSIMVARSDNDKLSFHNVMGWIRIALTGYETIKTITFQGNNDELIAGSATIKSDMSVEIATDGTKVITLDCGDGVTLSKEKPTYFYMAVPPQTFEKGISINITGDYCAMKLQTTKTMTVARNHIVSLASFNCGITQDKPANNQITYVVLGDNASIITPKSYNGNIISNICIHYYYNYCEGVITFDCEQTAIDDSAFSKCTKLKEIIIPDSVKAIGDSAFNGCTGLTKVTFGNNVATIGEQAFYGCTLLTSAEFPNSVTTIGRRAFDNCTNLTNVTFGNNITEIDSNAFAYTSLTSISIPKSVTTIGGEPFGWCNNLSSVYIEDLVAWCKVTGGPLVQGGSANRPLYSLYLNGKLVTDLVIPDGFTAIDNCVFANCKSLRSLTISESVTSICAGAFECCTGLTSVTIPDSVTTIGSSAFNDCVRLSSITIPDSVTRIGSSAFGFCDNLKKVYCKAAIPPTLGSQVFYTSYNSVPYIYVPNESVSKYRSATNWKDYSYYIRGYDF